MAGNQRLDVKEYIGARYIPIFFDDGTGSAEWRSTFEYEPLYENVSKRGNPSHLLFTIIKIC